MKDAVKALVALEVMQSVSSLDRIINMLQGTDAFDASLSMDVIDKIKQMYQAVTVLLLDASDIPPEQMTKRLKELGF